MKDEERTIFNDISAAFMHPEKMWAEIEALELEVLVLEAACAHYKARWIAALERERENSSD